MMRIGLGYDLHRLAEGRPFILGGVTIPHEKGLLGHSDADVLAHAITDALLGAAALGNIGILYPDTDPKYKGANSLLLLRNAADLVEAAGYSIVNIDAVVIAQKPKLNPHIPAIQEKLARTLNLPVECISVKPKTNEGLGPEGREEAVSVQAAVLIEK